MKKSIQNGICILSTLAVLGLGMGGVTWHTDNKINALKKEIEQKYEEKVPVNQIVKAFNSTYMILNQVHFKTEKQGVIPQPTPYTGSGILMKGGYFLTASHVTDLEFDEYQSPVYGKMNYDYSRYYLSDEAYSAKQTKKCELEKIIIGSNESLDYALLKVKGDIKLPYYPYGLNIPSNIDMNTKTIVMGFPLGEPKTKREGDIIRPENKKSEKMKDYIVYANWVLPTDSGGPMFVKEYGNLKLAAISLTVYRANIGESMTISPNGRMVTKPIFQYLNINTGLKIEAVIKDMEKQLDSGKLDKGKAEEVRNFLKLNKK